METCSSSSESKCGEPQLDKGAGEGVITGFGKLEVKVSAGKIAGVSTGKENEPFSLLLCTFESTLLKCNTDTGSGCEEGKGKSGASGSLLGEEDEGTRPEGGDDGAESKYPATSPLASDGGECGGASSEHESALDPVSSGGSESCSGSRQGRQSPASWTDGTALSMRGRRGARLADRRGRGNRECRRRGSL